MAVAFLPMLPGMQRYCTFSAILDETKLTAVMKRPQESATGSGLLAPFEKTVWLLVLASLIFVGPVIYIIASIRYNTILHLFGNFQLTNIRLSIIAEYFNLA